MASGSDNADSNRRWTRIFIGLIGLGCLVGIAVPAGLGWDFANFYDAGRRVAAGQFTDLYDPGSLINGRPPQGSTGFFGAPISAFFYTPLAPFGAGTALVLFKVQNVLAFGLTFVALLKFYRPFVSGARLTPPQFTALFVFLCLIYQPFWTVFRVGGQTTPTVLLCLSLGLIAHTRGRLWASATFVVLAALIKPSLAPAVILLAAISGLDYFWRMAALWSATGALSLAILGWPVHATFIETMLYRAQVKYSWFYNSALEVWPITLRQYAGAGATGTVDLIATGLTYGLRAIVLLTVLWLVLAARRLDWSAAARRHFNFSLVLVFYLTWSPTVYEHYLSVLFPFLVYVVAANEHFTRRALLLVGLIFAFSIGQNLILVNLLRYSIEVDSLAEVFGVAFYKSAPLVLTMTWLWLHGREWLQSHGAPQWARLIGTERAPA